MALAVLAVACPTRLLRPTKVASDSLHGDCGRPIDTKQQCAPVEHAKSINGVQMRQQYHSRLVNGRTYSLDVYRLIELTRSNPVQQFPLARIAELDACFWFQSEPAPCRAVALHAKMIQEVDSAYPIILSSSGQAMDGMHRVCKAMLEGRSVLPAVQFREDPVPDYIDADIDSLPYDEPR
jgi:hypothetical protein